MSSEPVSDKRLEELIANNRRAAEQWNQFDADQRSRNPEYDSFAEEEINAQYSALTELKALRAQQATKQDRQAAIFEEMRKEVESEHDGAVLSPEGAKRFNEVLSSSACQRRQKPQMLPEYAQQAKPPAGCAEMAKAVRVAINEHLDKHPMNGEVSFAGCEDELIEEAVAAKLAPLFTLQSDMYSLLLECREYTMQRVTLRTLNHDKGKALLAKLYAALGKGDADGGREVVK